FLQSVTQRSLDSIRPAFALSQGPTVDPVPATPDAGLGQGAFTVDRDLGSGYQQHWNVAFQREVSEDLAFEIAYAGSKGTHIGIPDTNINQLGVDQLAQGSSLLQRVPNPFFGEIPASSSLGGPTLSRAQLLARYPRFTTVSFYRNNVGDTNYHALQMKLEKRFSRGLAFLLSYTRSRLMDDASSVFDATILAGPVANYPVADTFNRKLERDYSTGDIPHAFVGSFTYDVPFQDDGILGVLGNDWTIAGVATLQSGLPLAVTQQTNFNAFAGFGTQRPNLVGDPELPSSERSPSRWFDTAAFAVAPQFTLGSSSRNPVRGPGYRNLDLAFLRNVELGGRWNAQIRVEIFNVTNTPPFGAPNTVLGNPAFGSIASAGDPRVVQLGVKLSF
ncbi:MAG: carboxypeptidase regulatory-like domain-containing protein, partial [Vicinamibacteria bacterium]